MNSARWQEILDFFPSNLHLANATAVVVVVVIRAHLVAGWFIDIFYLDDETKVHKRKLIRCFTDENDIILVRWRIRHFIRCYILYRCFSWNYLRKSIIYLYLLKRHFWVTAMEKRWPFCVRVCNSAVNIFGSAAVDWWIFWFFFCWSMVRTAQKFQFKFKLKLEFNLNESFVSKF